jgi:hypothetical protein
MAIQSTHRTTLTHRVKRRIRTTDRSPRRAASKRGAACSGPRFPPPPRRRASPSPRRREDDAARAPWVRSAPIRLPHEARAHDQPMLNRPRFRQAFDGDACAPDCVVGQRRSSQGLSTNDGSHGLPTRNEHGDAALAQRHGQVDLHRDTRGRDRQRLEAFAHAPGDIRPRRGSILHRAPRDLSAFSVERHVERQTDLRGCRLRPERRAKALLDEHGDLSIERGLSVARDIVAGWKRRRRGWRCADAGWCAGRRLRGAGKRVRGEEGWCGRSCGRIGNRS